MKLNIEAGGRSCREKLVMKGFDEESERETKSKVQRLDTQSMHG